MLRARGWSKALLVLASVLSLAGCSLASAQAAPLPTHEVRLSAEKGAFGLLSWDYRTADATWERFPPCTVEGFFGATVCKSEDGARVFSYRLYNGEVLEETYSLGGEVLPISCSPKVVAEKEVFCTLKSVGRQ